MERRTFRAMGTDIELVDADDAGEALEAAASSSTGSEALLSRFRAESELSQLNRERSIDAGPDLLRVIALALAARERTDGRFEPTVHDAVVAAGYDRTFDEGSGRRRGVWHTDAAAACASTATGSSSTRVYASTSAGSPGLCRRALCRPRSARHGGLVSREW